MLGFGVKAIPKTPLVCQDLAWNLERSAHAALEMVLDSMCGPCSPTPWVWPSASHGCQLALALSFSLVSTFSSRISIRQWMDSSPSITLGMPSMFSCLSLRDGNQRDDFVVWGFSKGSVESLPSLSLNFEFFWLNSISRSLFEIFHL